MGKALLDFSFSPPYTGGYHPFPGSSYPRFAKKWVFVDREGRIDIKYTEAGVASTAFDESGRAP
jgi:uncharacterized membrane protein